MRKKVKNTKEKEKFICTSCGGDAYIAYTAKKKSDWNGIVKIGERLCTKCFRKRNGKPIF